MASKGFSLIPLKKKTKEKVPGVEMQIKTKLGKCPEARIVTSNQIEKSLFNNSQVYTNSVNDRKINLNIVKLNNNNQGMTRHPINSLIINCGRFHTNLLIIQVPIFFKGIQLKHY